MIKVVSCLKDNELDVNSISLNDITGKVVLIGSRARGFRLLTCFNNTYFFTYPTYGREVISSALTSDCPIKLIKSMVNSGSVVHIVTLSEYKELI